MIYDETINHALFLPNSQPWPRLISDHHGKQLSGMLNSSSEPYSLIISLV